MIRSTTVISEVGDDELGVCEQHKQWRTEHTALGSARAHHEGAWCSAAYPHCLWSSCYKVQDPVAQWGAETQHGEFPYHLPSNDCIECWAEVHEQYSGVSVLGVYQEQDLAIITFIWTINLPKIEKPLLEEIYLTFTMRFWFGSCPTRYHYRTRFMTYIVVCHLGVI